MTTENRIDSVGWIFFGVMLALLIAPCIYGVYAITNTTVTIGIRVGMGIFLAFFAAGFISWIVNSMLYFRARKLYERDERRREEAQATKNMEKTDPKKKQR